MFFEGCIFVCFIAIKSLFIINEVFLHPNTRLEANLHLID